MTYCIAPFTGFHDISAWLFENRTRSLSTFSSAAGAGVAVALGVVPGLGVTAVGGVIPGIGVDVGETGAVGVTVGTGVAVGCADAGASCTNAAYTPASVITLVAAPAED
jgi:hypothetical protein